MIGITPSEVSDNIATAFLVALEEEGIIRNPRQVHRTMCIVWNRAEESIAAWPRSRLPVPQYRRAYSLSWSYFPPSLGKEAAAYFDRLSGKDLLAELDIKPLRITSIRSYDRLLRAFLSALIHRGHDSQSLRSHADIVVVEIVKDGLRFFIERAGGRRAKQAYNVARMLTALARHWVRVDDDHLKQLSAICQRLDSGKTGLTLKNRNRLRQFDDPVNIHDFVTLPQRVAARHKGRTHPSRANAIELQSALAVDLLQLIPMRIGNLASLDLDRNILRTRANGSGVTHLVVPAEKVKNGIPIEAEFPPETVKLLELYLERFRPLLLPYPSPWLFPNSSGGPKSAQTLGLQISKFLPRECGLQINPHLFRHIAAKLYLDAHPGAYSVIRLVHGHASVETTTRAYCGTETAAAMLHFDEHVLRLRRKAPPLPKRRRRSALWSQADD